MASFRSTRLRRSAVAVGLLAAVALGFAAFLITRQIVADAPVRADPAQQPTALPSEPSTPAPGVEPPPGPHVTPKPGATPDTSKPYWFVPYDNQDRMLPRYDTVVGGIAIGPTVERQMRPCNGRVSTADYEAASGSPVAMEPSYLPAGTVLITGRGVTLCDGEPIAAWADYSIPTDPDAFRQVVSGEKTWFEVQRGGFIKIGRFYGEPAIEDDIIATERWKVVDFLDGMAVAGGPVIEAGWGISAVYVYRDGVMTAVVAGHLTLDETLRIAEGLFK